MKVNSDLSRQEIWAEGDELVGILGRDRDEHGNRVRQRPYSEKELVAEIINPVLLTDIYAISKLPPTKRDNVFSLYSCYPRTVEYDSVSVWWDPKRHVDVWCPSIDTLVFANSMRMARNLLTDEIKSAVDIGCASGFLGKYVLNKCNKLEELYVVDINPYAITCAEDNLHGIDKKQRIVYVEGDGRRLRGKKFDLVTCNPPYVPRPRSIDDNPYEGVGLLQEMIVNGRDYLNKKGALIITTSSLCREIKDRCIEEAKEKGLVSADVIGTKCIPFKVNPILNNDGWMSYLHEKGLEKRLERGYEYWHEISILKLVYQ